MLLAARFVVGAPLGKRRTDATFLSRGTRPVGGVPSWFTTGQPGRWAYPPGWQRAAVRWAAVAAAIGLYARPLITAAVLGGLAVAAGAALALLWRRAWYVRAVVRPVYLQLCSYLGTDPAASPLRWLDVPRGFTATPDAVVTLTYPAAWNPDAAKQKNIDEVIRRHLGGDLTGTFGPHTATWRHPPAPPRRALFDGYTQPAHRIHLATLPGGRKWIVDLEHEEPHLFIAAGTGGGKTATASVAAAHARAHGWLIDIIDPKRRSYIDRKTGADVLTNVPGIRVHTDIEAMMWALEEFFLSMLGVNIAVGSHAAWPGAFPQRMLVIDEFGTFAGMAARIHHRTGHAGPLPALDQRRQIEWQGRVAGHRLLVAVHQPNLRLFADSDSRASYGYRLITGAYTASLWRMTFGYAPPIEWDARIKGRGVVGIGEASSLIHHAQIAWLPAPERRRYALTGPPPPTGTLRCGRLRGSHPACWPKDASSPAPASSPSPPARRPPSPLSLSHPDSRHPRQRKHCPASRPGTPPRTRPTALRTESRTVGTAWLWGSRALPTTLAMTSPTVSAVPVPAVLSPVKPAPPTAARPGHPPPCAPGMHSARSQAASARTSTKSVSRVRLTLQLVAQNVEVCF